jgi:signal transduction histidine kinase
MENLTSQDHKSTPIYFSISLLLILCTIIIWILVLYVSFIERTDRALQQEARRINSIAGILTESGVPPFRLISQLSNYINQERNSLSIEILGTDGSSLLKTGYADSSFAGSVNLIEPSTVRIKGNNYRIYAETFNNHTVYVAAIIPTYWVLVKEGYSNPIILLPSLTVLFILLGTWRYRRLHKPVQKLNQYLQSLIQQPVGNDYLKLPATPKGEVNQLTKTVSKLLEKLHTSRNQALQFSSFATHELRTPLAIIRNQLESALVSHSRIKEIRSITASVYDEILRLNRTVEDLLSLGTMQSGTLALNTETISLFQFLNNFYDEALFLSRPKNITVVLKKGPEVYLKADIIRLRQVFFNLLDNSIKNTPAGNRIRISYNVDGNSVVIKFADTGSGIAKDNLEKIFDPFISYAQKGTNHRSSGLGLALVKWIIELHKGKISVTSEINKGTEFNISLPYEQIVNKT